MAASIENVFQLGGSLETKLLSDHSWGTAIAARSIAKRVRYEKPEEALVCGLMHDIGKAVLMRNFKDVYSDIINNVYSGDSSFHQSELQSFGFSHAHVGALLAHKWNYPLQLEEAVGHHHDPLSAPNYCQLACIINLANLFMISMEIGFEKDADLDLVKQPASEHLQLNEAALTDLVADIHTGIKATSNIG